MWFLLPLVFLAPPAPTGVPEELFFGLSGLEQRILFTPTPVTRSGAYDFALVEMDRLAGAKGPRYRLVVACTRTDGAHPPADLTVLGDAYATTDRGRELPVHAVSLVRGRTAWFTFTLDPGGPAASLQALAATVGPVPDDVVRRVALPLSRLGAATACDEAGCAVRVSLLRRETTILDVEPDGPPYYSSIESTVGRPEAPPPADPAGSFVTLRVHTLRPPNGEGDWRLSNLRLQGGGDQAIDDWRYVRRTWRPDWGGWLGVKGRDWERAEGSAQPPTRAVEVEAVSAGSPAHHAGLQKGDLVVALGDRRVEDAYTLGDLVRRTAPGRLAKLDLRRGGQRLVLPVKLGKQSLWPDLDDLEFQDAWQALSHARGAAAEPGRDVVAQWDWQSRFPLPASFEPHSLELVFDRPGPVEGTSFLFRRIPLPAQR